MNIGIDIDGVITNVDFLSILGKTTPVLDRESKNLKTNNKALRKLLYKGIAFYSKHSKLRPNASKYIKLLKEEGNRIIVITKRKFANEDSKEGKNIRTLIELFLLENDMPYDKIIFSSGDKLEDCTIEDITIMLEDSPKNATSISQRLPVILMNTPYNQNTTGDNIFRVNSWDEAYVLLSALGRRKAKNYEKN